jgi:HD-like signal output (HDOD) protein
MDKDQDLSTLAYRFVQELAANLSADNLDLPGFPDTILELHRALGDINQSVKDVVMIINSEPVLAARLIRLANSAAFNTTKAEICDPRAAITQLGFNVVRSTATEFAMRQLEQQEWLRPVRPQLAEIKVRANGTAAICAGIAKNIDGMRADEGLAVGLFHQIGNLYLLMQGHKNNLVQGNPVWGSIAREWHPTIARAIIESWGMPEPVAVAVEHQDVLLHEEDDSTALLTRLLGAAKLYHELTTGNADGTQNVEGILTSTVLIDRPFIDLATHCRDDIDLVRRTMAA